MDLATLFIERSRHYLGTEYRTKIRLAVESMPAEALWWRANDQSNSVGNLLKHLAGNVRQWIVSGVGQRADVRDRAGEFAAREGADAATLLATLDAVLDETDEVLRGLTPADLSRTFVVQARDVNVAAAVYHVVEHFAMHSGQIILLAKMHAPGAIKFYEDAGGNARPIWGDEKL